MNHLGASDLDFYVDYARRCGWEMGGGMHRIVVWMRPGNGVLGVYVVFQGN
jgi:hypothetical protein